MPEAELLCTSLLFIYGQHVRVWKLVLHNERHNIQDAKSTWQPDVVSMYTTGSDKSQPVTDPWGAGRSCTSFPIATFTWLLVTLKPRLRQINWSELNSECVQIKQQKRSHRANWSWRTPQFVNYTTYIAASAASQGYELGRRDATLAGRSTRGVQ